MARDSRRPWARAALCAALMPRGLAAVFLTAFTVLLVVFFAVVFVAARGIRGVLSRERVTLGRQNCVRQNVPGAAIVRTALSNVDSAFVRRGLSHDPVPRIAGTPGRRGARRARWYRARVPEAVPAHRALGL